MSRLAITILRYKEGREEYPSVCTGKHTQRPDRWERDWTFKSPVLGFYQRSLDPCHDPLKIQKAILVMAFLLYLPVTESNIFHRF